MVKTLKQIFLAMVFLAGFLVCQNAFAATYYIDFDSGADTNNGTSALTSFKHCPGDDSATDTSAGTTLAAGDTVIFKGGIVYKGKVDLDWSGSAGNIITYDGNSAGTWGTGKAIIDGENSTDLTRRRGFVAGSSRSYITIKNFEIRHIGGGQIPVACDTSYSNSGYGIYFPSGATNIIIQDNYLWDIGNWEYLAFSNRASMEGRAIVFSGTTVSNIVVSGNEITKIAFQGINIGGKNVSAIEIANNSVHGQVVWGMSVSIGYTGAVYNDIDIHHNQIYDLGINPDTRLKYLWIGCSGTYPHLDSIILTPNLSRGLTLGTPENPLRIRNNFFYNNTTETTGGGTADIFMTAWGGTVYIYNNLFIKSRAVYGSIYGQGMNRDHAADYHVYNNSYYGARFGFRLRDAGGIPFTTRTAINVKNNTFHHMTTSTTIPIQAIGGSHAYFTAIDNNVFYTLRSSGEIFSADGIYYDVTELNALDNASGNVRATEQFYSDLSLGLGLYSSSNDLHLLESSNPVGIGGNLSSYFTDDYASTARASSPTAWDAGAYVYGGASLDITSPTVQYSIIKENGTDVMFGFSELITSVSGAAFTLDTSGAAITLTCPSITSATTMTCTTDRMIKQNETSPVYGYSGTKVTDIATNQLAVIASATATNNSEQQDTPTYTLTVTEGAGVDTIVKTPSTAVYDSGTSVSIDVSCLSGYGAPTFSGDFTSSPVIMNSNKTATVSCSAQTLLTVTVPANGEIVTSDMGEIDCDANQNQCTETYYNGALVTLTIDCASGWINPIYSGDCSGSACILEMTEDRDVAVTCSPSSDSTPPEITAFTESKKYKLYKKYKEKYKSKVNLKIYHEMKALRKSNPQAFLEMRNLYKKYKGWSDRERNAYFWADWKEMFSKYKKYSGYKNYRIYKEKVGL